MKKPLKKPWTVLVYMVTDSAKDPSAGSPLLDTVAEQDALQMLKAFRRHADRMHVAIQADLKAVSGTYRWILGQDISFHRESMATTTRTLNGFFEWGRRACPAERYAVLFWGHSAGPMGLFSEVQDGKIKDELSLKELSAGLRHMSRKLLNRRSIDLVLFKNCFQGILETAFETRDSARFLLASQGLIPAANWPYGKLFSALASGGPTRTIAGRILQDLGDFYVKETNRGDLPEVPFALLDLQALDRVVTPMKKLADALAQALTAETRHAFMSAWVNNDPPGVASAVTTSQARFVASLTPGDAVLLDMKTLCHTLINLRVPVFSPLAEALEPKLARVVLAHRPDQSRFRGVSVYYFPTPSAKLDESNIGSPDSRSKYRELVCSRKTHWDKIALANP